MNNLPSAIKLLPVNPDYFRFCLFSIKSKIKIAILWKCLKFSKILTSVWVIKQTYVWVLWNSFLLSKRVITSNQFIWNKSCMGGLNWTSLSQVLKVAIIVWDFNFENPYSNFKIKISRITKGLKRTRTSKSRLQSERSVLFEHLNFHSDDDQL